MSVFSVPSAGAGTGAPGVAGTPGSATAGGYAQIYSSGSIIPQTLTAAAGYEKARPYNFNGLSAGNATPDHTLDRITFGVAGIWYVFFSISWSSEGTPLGPGGAVRIFKNGVTPVPEISAEELYLPRISNFQFQNVAGGNRVRFEAGDFVEVFIDTTTDRALTYNQAQLVAYWEAP